MWIIEITEITWLKKILSENSQNLGHWTLVHFELFFYAIDFLFTFLIMFFLIYLFWFVFFKKNKSD